MDTFIQNYREDVIGVLNGFDRMRFRGTLRSISYADGFDRFLGAMGVRYKDFSEYVQGLSQRLKDHAREVAESTGRPLEYLSSSRQAKESVARSIAERDGITDGLVCILSCVEPCVSFCIRRDDSGRFRFRSQERKCLHLYYYYLDRQFGLMHVRLSTWVPFPIQVCLNGREYLARRLRAAGIGFEQRDNCFVRIDDLARAQRMMHELEGRKWERLLKSLGKRVNPLVGSPGGLDLYPYYWSIRESEYATDVMFKNTAALQRIYGPLCRYAIEQFGSKDVLRFLGRRTNSRFSGEVCSSYLERREGLRVKHWLDENSIKMYDKEGCILRIETTINNARRFKVRRMTLRKGVRRMRWIPMRHGLADLGRRIKISLAANERYLEALCVVEFSCPAGELVDSVSRRRIKDSRPYRALHPLSRADAALFKVVLSGQFVLKGFTNRHLREGLGLEWPSDRRQRSRISARVTRLIRLLRAHKLIRKVSHTRYYRITAKGQKVMSGALKLRNADIAKLAA